jgi:hypothetical protein
MGWSGRAPTPPTLEADQGANDEEHATSEKDKQPFALRDLTGQGVAVNHERPIWGVRAMSASPPEATKSLRRTKWRNEP